MRADLEVLTTLVDAAAEPPARIRSQPRLEELLGLLGLTHLEVGLSQRPAAVPIPA